MEDLRIDVANPYKDAIQVDGPGMGINNLSFTPTVEEFNHLIGSSDDAGVRNVSGNDEVEPLFGTHIREAAATLKKLF